ncbi:hypothetical protein HC931_22325 [Candidatus Gracilibacteria bacterium]|nr:hypothetical protein [Candidatus Gracilibacteria bacterium]NJM89267.1 hypothetical protein [Hydrococcus sp. RU_2_2]NJP21055.1 hypothetical protein [Hydrococcus sp. CRU_1_1]NJQ96574.1 hypothetical protein [Hydrococcus sp. CSU_1_8]
MGEAKRRKKLDSTWGNPEVNKERLAEVERRFARWESDCIGTSVSNEVLFDEFMEILAYAKAHGICVYYGGKEVANPKPPIRGRYFVKVFLRPY